MPRSVVIRRLGISETALKKWMSPKMMDESEEISVVQRMFFIKKNIRKKYRCKCGGCIKTASKPPSLIEGGRYTPEFAVEVATEKYLDHMPLERQVRKMKREGLKVDSQTLWDQLWYLSRILKPVQLALKQSDFRKAVEYMLGHWEKLMLFLDDPYIPLSTPCRRR